MMKETKRYLFSVEGDTEHWYLNWLQEQINSAEEARFKVKLDAPVQKNPAKRAKGLSTLGKTQIYHLCDYESDDPIHIQRFQTALSQMKEVKSYGKSISYHLGYSNFTFELWMVLHKRDCNGSLTHRSQYLTHINQAYNENFENLDKYKKEDNFKRILSQLTLEDVRDAIRRARNIMQNNQNNGLVEHEYKGYKYYKVNPALSIWEIIEGILDACV